MFFNTKMKKTSYSQLVPLFKQRLVGFTSFFFHFGTENRAEHLKNIQLIYSRKHSTCTKIYRLLTLNLIEGKVSEFLRSSPGKSALPVISSAMMHPTDQMSTEKSKDRGKC